MRILSEEHKRKISEALKESKRRNGYENPLSLAVIA